MESNLNNVKRNKRNFKNWKQKTYFNSNPSGQIGKSQGKSNNTLN